MNVCVAHLQMNACVAKNFGAWTEKVGHPCPTFMAHPTRVGRRVGALHKKLGHPWAKVSADGTNKKQYSNCTLRKNISKLYWDNKQKHCQFNIVPLLVRNIYFISSFYKESRSEQR